jgi:hypothetical protein
MPKESILPSFAEVGGMNNRKVRIHLDFQWNLWSKIQISANQLLIFFSWGIDRIDRDKNPTLRISQRNCPNSSEYQVMKSDEREWGLIYIHAYTLYFLA